MESEKAEPQDQVPYLLHLRITSPALWLRVLDTISGLLGQASDISYALPATHSTNQMEQYVSNLKVSKYSGLQDLHTIVRSRRLGLFRHIARLPNNVPANQALAICCQVRTGIKPGPGWKRPRGRPPTTWVHQIHRDTGIPATRALQLERDRRFWRTIATTNGNG